MLGDRINHMIGCGLPENPGDISLPAGSQLSPVLACNDRVVRVLSGSAIAYEVDLDTVPCVLCAYDAGPNTPRGEVLFGAQDGQFGLLQLGRYGVCVCV